MLRANMDALSAIAGMFILLPAVAIDWILPDRPRLPRDATLIDMMNANSDYIAAHWPLMLLNALLVSFGSLAFLALIAHRSRPTVAQSLRIGLVALPTYLLANMAQSVLLILGAMLLILPGLYLVGRLICIAPVAVAEGVGNPLLLLSRSFQLTRGNGWRIVLLLVLVFLVAIVLSSALASVVGVIAALLLPPDIGRFVMILVRGCVEAGLAVVMLSVSAAVYAQATTRE